MAAFIAGEAIGRASEKLRRNPGAELQVVTSQSNSAFESTPPWGHFPCPDATRNFPFEDHHISHRTRVCLRAASRIHDSLQLQISGASVRISTRGNHAKSVPVCLWSRVGSSFFPVGTSQKSQQPSRAGIIMVEAFFFFCSGQHVPSLAPVLRDL